MGRTTAPRDDRGSSPPGRADVTAQHLAERLDAIPGVGQATAQIVLAEIGLDMSRFPTPEHLVSWAKLCPRTIQSGAKNTAGPAARGNR
ncbi:IS110 family transposase [Streptomyces sp. NPDC046859]|uniref:IS110 family transposase n=1 Tax=Streptomyces sp. NPDC046859 TaxID=3155734 RepID=UPI0033C9B046